MARRTRGPSRGRAFRVVLTRVGVLAALLVVWQILSWSHVLDPDFVASPLDIASGIGRLLTDPDALYALGRSVASFVVAFVVGSSLGIVLGFALGLSILLRAAFGSWILFWLSSPKSAFLPIFLLMFGIGQEMAIAFGAFSAIPYVAVNVVAGIDLAPPLNRRTARAFGAGPLAEVRTVVLPTALPGVVIGLWHSANRSVGGVLIVELFVSATMGAGALLKNYGATFDTSMLMATMVVVSIIAILFAQVWAVLEDRVSRWKQRELDAVAP